MEGLKQTDLNPQAPLSECQLKHSPSLGKRVQKYRLYTYNPNTSYYFFKENGRVAGKDLISKRIKANLFFDGYNTKGKAHIII